MSKDNNGLWTQEERDAANRYIADRRHAQQKDKEAEELAKAQAELIESIERVNEETKREEDERENLKGFKVEPKGKPEKEEPTCASGHHMVCRVCGQGSDKHMKEPQEPPKHYTTCDDLDDPRNEADVYQCTCGHLKGTHMKGPFGWSCNADNCKCIKSRYTTPLGKDEMRREKGAAKAKNPPKEECTCTRYEGETHEKVREVNPAMLRRMLEVFPPCERCGHAWNSHAVWEDGKERRLGGPCMYDPYVGEPLFVENLFVGQWAAPIGLEEAREADQEDRERLSQQDLTLKWADLVALAHKQWLLSLPWRSCYRPARAPPCLRERAKALDGAAEGLPLLNTALNSALSGTFAHVKRVLRRVWRGSPGAP